jgi:hypothetical protein
MQKIKIIGGVVILILLLLYCNKKIGKALEETNDEYSIEAAKTIHTLGISQTEIAISSIEAETSSAYGIVIWKDQKIVYIPNINLSEVWNIIAPQPGSMYVGGDFVNNDYSKMYVVSYTFGDLRLVDMKTGGVTIIGKMQLTGDSELGGWTGLTGLSNGLLYASSTNINESYLYTVNLTTGATTPIGEITNAPCIIDIAITEAYQMYGVDICLDSLISINPITASGKVIGPINFNANHAQDMDYDENSKRLYLAAYNNDTGRGEMRLANVDTGMTNLVGVFYNNDEVDCFAFTEKIIYSETFLPMVEKNPFLPIIEKNP